MDAGRLEGVIPLAGGVYAYLLYFGGIIKVAAPICIVFGLLLLLGIVGS